MRKHSQQQYNKGRLPETLIAIGELAQAVAHEIGGVVGPVQFTVCRDLAAAVVREKRCPACGEVKPLDAFSKAGYCHPCNNRKGREYSKANREIRNAARRRSRSRPSLSIGKGFRGFVTRRIFGDEDDRR